ncbi:MAG: nucleotidyltransferase family protein [Bythopirellula sp.]|nr:nucleotidyltransferase family protein [Bythopirellula sp.]
MPSCLIEQRESILRIAENYGASNVRVFGSTARGTSTADSDIDILVALAVGRSLLDQVGLKQDLETLLGRCVDVLVEGGISPYLEQQILAEAVPL